MAGVRQLVILVLFYSLSGLFNQIIAQKESVKAWAVRSTSPIKIDGYLNDETWKIAPAGKDFIQYAPDNGGKPVQKTVAKFAYDNTALYLGLMMYDSAPDSIRVGLSERDNFNNADDVGIYFDPTGTGMNGFGFFVSASGIQVDLKVDQYNEDGSWDAVWESKTAITDSGWIAEVKIPFTSLRFPKAAKQNWKINVWRHITRYNQYSTLYFVDKRKDGLLTQNGILEGVENIEPPLRLSFMPYMSAYVSKKTNEPNYNKDFNGGMDLKYGINESFTLDMTLIPDFGQVQSDDKVLNISPFEVFYSEKRPFFTEGTELFNKLGLFHSRRVGGTPVRHDSVENQLKSGETITNNPVETKMINATKITGRNSHGLGIGVFNGITSNTYATIRDSTGKEREYLTQPFTNYNVVVFDQDLKNNSYFNITNTNVLRKTDGYMANVSGGDVVLKNKNKTYSYKASYVISQVYDENKKNDFGHHYKLKFSKISGQIQGSLAYMVFSNNFNINDAGYLERKNYSQAELFLRHQMSNPFWIFNGMFSYIDVFRYALYKPSGFTSLEIYGHCDYTFKNNYSGGINVSYFPYGTKDYFEPRVEGRYVISVDKQYHAGTWINTDSRKKLFFTFNPGILWTDTKDNFNYWFNESVNYRMSNKLSFSFSTSYDIVFKQKSWVKTCETKDTIYFGFRDVETISNLFETKYILTRSAYASLRIRHYNRSVDYDNRFYTLKNNGRLKECNYSSNHNKNYNVFNVDMVFAWRFAPGSEFSAVWKNIVEPEEENMLASSYYSNLKHTLNSDQNNSFSIKIIYYFDYLYLKKYRKG